MSEKSPKDIKNTCKTNIYKFRANSKKAQQVNPSPFKSAQVPWTYFYLFKWSRDLRNVFISELKSFLYLQDDGTHLRYVNDYNRTIYAFEMLPPPLVEEISGNISDDTSTLTSDATSHGSTGNDIILHYLIRFIIIHLMKYHDGFVGYVE